MFYFFQNSLEFQVNLENTHPTLTILKVVLALKVQFSIHSSTFSGHNKKKKLKKIMKMFNFLYLITKVINKI